MITIIKKIPLLFFPLLIYNLFFIYFSKVTPSMEFSKNFMKFLLPSGGEFFLSYGTVFLILVLLLLFFEILRAASAKVISLADHIFSLIIFILYLIEFLLWSRASNELFFIISLMAFFDVLAGMIISFSIHRQIYINPVQQV